MVAEVLAGIALVSSAVKGIKSAVDSAKDIKDIAGSIDQLLDGAEQVDKRAASVQKKGDAGKWQNFLRLKFNQVEETGDGTSLQEVAAEIIEKKQVERQIENMRRLINNKFGPSTWDDIMIMRQQRIEELELRRNKAKVLARERAEAKQKQLKKILKESLNVIALIVVGCGVFFTIMYLADQKKKGQGKYGFNNSVGITMAYFDSDNNIDYRFGKNALCNRCVRGKG